MSNLRSLKNIGVYLYLSIYLIFPYPATTQLKKVDLRRNIENGLNSRDLNFIKESFTDDVGFVIQKNFYKIIKEFPNAQWEIKLLDKKNPNEGVFQIKVNGKKTIGRETYTLNSNFSYLFSIVDGKINSGSLKNLFTVIRNDEKRIDITFRIPKKVLTGTKYDIDIILNKPLEEVIVAGGIKPYQEESFLEQEIEIEPLVSGGIFKMTRAPSKPGLQIWSGIIAHPNGIITFTKSVDIVEKI